MVDGAFGVVRTDLAGGGFGTPWGATWTWSNGAGFSDGAAGEGAALTPLPRVVPVNGNTSYALLGSATDARFFDEVLGTYRARNGDLTTFAADPVAGTLVATDPDGTVSTFYDFSFGTPSGREGTLISVADPAGNLTTVTAWTGSGRPAEVQRTVGAGGSAVTESFLYTYVSGGVNAGRVGSVTLRRAVGGGAWATVRGVAYTYHDGSTADGLAGDLKLAVVSDAAGSPIDSSYYRYYTAASGTGYAHGLKYAFGPAAYARLTAALGAGVSTLTDGQVDDYADDYLEYDGAQRVTKRVAAGAGGAATGGLGTFTYAYATSSAAPGGTNAWRYKTVETLPDGSTTTYYANAVGAVMLTAFTDAATSQTWVTATRYDGVGRVVLAAAPSAVTGYSDTYSDLLNDVGGNLQYLADAAGLVTTYTYAAATTATTSTPGDAAGYLASSAVRRGEGGTAVPQEARTYVETPAGTFAPAGTTVYRNDNGTGGITTTLSYTWQGSTARPDRVTTTLPVVSGGQNGSGSATSTVAAYDTFGRPVWVKDPAGFLAYTEYDPVTGAAVKTITDVDVTQTTTFAGLPSGWTTPVGGGAHLTTTYEVDALGRVTKLTRPGGRVDYTVYLDAAHEARSYPAWDTTANAPTGPTTVVREDRANGYAETFTMTATPALSSGRPTGGESVGALQSLSRTHVNAAGQPIYSDAYFDLSGLTYTTSASLGTSGTNFDRTTTAYDAPGRADRSVTPLGTITRTVYDGLGRAVGVWVGTDDTPTTGSWSPTNTTGTNLVLVREDEYDGGGVGDGNLTSTTAYPGLSVAARVTETYYDWRNRAVAVKAGVEGSEGTGVNRPITYTDYDNLGNAVRVRMYDGDGVAVTSTSGVPNAPSSSLLRSKAETSYDELGRVYRTDTFGVDPSSGSVGSYTLNSQTWYDARGLVIKTAAPGGLATKSVYDGAGRVIAVYTTDGGGDSGYGDADDVTGDKVLEQVETGYDIASRVNRRTTRARNHDETGTGTLASLAARVSYLGFYYDPADRPVATVDIGTSPGTVYSWPSSAPASTDTVLVSTTAYAADAVQTVRLTGSPTGGTFTLTFGGQTTSGIAYNASAATVQTAVQALASVGSGNALVTAAPGGGWQVRFAGTLAGKYAAKLTVGGAGLTGGTSPAVAVAVVSAGGDAGRAQTATDPLGRVTRTYYDALGRVTRTVENFTDGAVTDATDKTTDTAYNAAGRAGLTAYLTGGGAQTTMWVYGVTAGSGVTSNDVVGATRWPDATTGAASGAEQETVTVNALGQTVASTDRNGTVHTLTYDVLGRVTADAVTTLGSGVDGAVRRIETAYDGRGNAYLVTNYSAASGGSVVNQVQRGYNGLGQLTAEWQEHGGAVDTETVINPYTSPKVQYAYSEMPSGANHSRLTSVTYPSGYVINSTYASGLDASISRRSALADASGTVEAYSYLGLGTVVVRSHPQPDLDLTYVKRSGEPTGDAGDQYIGLDRFGRVVDQRWLDGSSGVATDRHEYWYDRAGNRVYRDNLVSAGLGEVYAYDGLAQVASFARGTLNGTKTGISGVAARTQSWDYDGVGNWDGVTTNGTTQSRTANRQNEVTSIGSLTTPGCGANGNLTLAETGLRYVYDVRARRITFPN